MNWYFCIPKSDVTKQMVNCSTSYSIDDMRKIWINGTIFKTEYCVFKVEEAIFNDVTYFDHLDARNNADMMKFIEENQTFGPE